MVSTSKPKLLIVDDNLCLCNALKEVLSTNFDLDFASNGRDALLKLLDAAPNCVLLDYQMPGLDGFEVLRCLKQQAPTVPVVLMSGFPITASALRQGADTFLSKPFSLAELNTALEQVLRSSEQ